MRLIGSGQRLRNSARNARISWLSGPTSRRIESRIKTRLGRSIPKPPRGASRAEAASSRSSKSRVRISSTELREKVIRLAVTPERSVNHAKHSAQPRIRCCRSKGVSRTGDVDPGSEIEPDWTKVQWYGSGRGPIYELLGNRTHMNYQAFMRVLHRPSVEGHIGNRAGMLAWRVTQARDSS